MGNFQKYSLKFSKVLTKIFKSSSVNFQKLPLKFSIFADFR